MINEIVKKQEPTIVLIHTKVLLNQFKTRLLQFSDIKEEDI